MESGLKTLFLLFILCNFRRNLELGLEILSLMPRTIVVLLGNPDFSRLQVKQQKLTYFHLQGVPRNMTVARRLESRHLSLHLFETFSRQPSFT